MKEFVLAAPQWPRTLAGRVLLIIFMGLVVAHLASFAFYEVERARAIDRYTATDIASRIVEFARLPAATTPPPRGGGPPRPRIRWQEVDALGEAPATGEPPSAGFASELRRVLTETLGADPVVWISTREAPHPPGAPPGPRPGGFERNARIFSIALRLPGGRQAIAEAMAFQPSLQIPAEAWASIVLIFVVTAMFSIWAVRLAVQPMRMLAAAADRLSRNIDEPPLPEKGGEEIRAATRAFNRMQDRLRRHVNSRALAFAAMSHDIRTPLTRMRLRLETLGEAAKEKLEDDLKEIEQIARSVLDVTRGLSHEEAVTRVDLTSLVHRLLLDYAPLGHVIELSGGCEPVDARPLALRRALANLVDNALKYGKKVRVELRNWHEFAEIRVCDEGPGIPREDLEKVVYPFYRVESSRNRDTGGAGLGLAIAKDIVEGHGGELLLENVAAGGFCATIRLPR